MAGLRTTFGSLFYKDNVRAEDDLTVARIPHAGGIGIGKSNTPEFGAGANTTNCVYGATVNRFDATSRVPVPRADRPSPSPPEWSRARGGGCARGGDPAYCRLGNIDFGAMFRRIEDKGFSGHYMTQLDSLQDMLDGRDYLVPRRARPASPEPHARR